MNNTTKYWLDAASFMSTIGVFAGWLTPILSFVALVLSITWLSIQIYDWLKRGRIN